MPAVAAAGLLLAVALLVQLRLRRCAAGMYWAVVVLVSVFGTMVADVAHVAGRAVRGRRVDWRWRWPRCSCSGTGWRGSLAIDRVTGLRRELFYWAAVLLTFALGTALGDLTAARTLHAGYLLAGLGFAVLITVPAVAARAR